MNQSQEDQLSCHSHSNSSELDLVMMRNNLIQDYMVPKDFRTALSFHLPSFTDSDHFPEFVSEIDLTGCSQR